MLQLKRSKTGHYELSDKKLAVTLEDRSIKLGGSVIDSPGEYEEGGVEVIYSDNAALLVWDHLQIAYVTSEEKPNAFEKNQFASANILLLSEVLGEVTKDKLSALTDVYDPQVVILSSKTPIEGQYKENIKPVEQPLLKLSAQTLPTEGRDYIILT
jgi:hypothetical protein